MNKAFEKIKVASAEIVVQGTSEKPYYEIKYYDILDGKYHIGYSSYDLSIVFGWLKECFEIVQEVSEEYNNGWIACSERLPEYGEVVMCSCTNSGITISCITHKGVKPSKSVRFGQHSVIAWQPLPEPFKESDCEVSRTNLFKNETYIALKE